MDKKVILEDNYVKMWFSEIGAEPRTINDFSYSLMLFCEFTGKTPKELIDEADNESNQRIPQRDKQLRRYLRDFPAWLEEDFKGKYGREIAPKTLKTRMTGIRSFYKALGFEVPRNSKKINRAERLPANGEMPTMEMVREAINVASVRDRAIVLAQLASGMGDGELLSLKLSDFMSGRGYSPRLDGRSESEIRRWIIEEKQRVSGAINESNLEFGITMIKGTRQRTKQPFTTFFTPEATLAVLDYLDWRNREPKQDNYHGKYLKAIVQESYEKRKIGSVDEFVFIRNNVPDEYLPLKTLKELFEGMSAYEEKYLKSKERREKFGDHPYDEKLRVLRVGGLTRVYRELATKIGVGTGYDKWQVLRGHKMRALFNALLENAGCPANVKEIFMGHKRPEQITAYSKMSDATLKENYIKYMKVLFTGRTEVKLLTSEEFKVVEEALGEKERRIADLEREIKELKSKEEARAPYDETLGELMQRLLNNPEMRALIKKELETVKNKEHDSFTG
jgi:integrase